MAALALNVPENRVILSWTAALSVLLGTVWLLPDQQRFRVNQFLLSSGLALIVLFSTIHSKIANEELIHDGSYYNPRYFLIGLCFVPFVIYDYRQQRALWISSGLNVMLLVLYIPIHRLMGADPMMILGRELGHDTFITIASSASGLAICLGMMALKKENFRFESRIAELLGKTRMQNEELNAGIRYARRLQESVLPSPRDYQVYAGKLASLFRPKDVLSGDFFYSAQIGDSTYVTVADCTGHGVPGAFVSLMAYKALEDIFRNLRDEPQPPSPARILHNLQQRIHSDLTSREGEMRDGMDLCMCAIDPTQQLIRWSGARGLGWLVRRKGVEKLECQRQSIGESGLRPFTDSAISYESGDLLVLCSDGYLDQFGTQGRKFGRKRFAQMLQGLYPLSVEAIAQKLEYGFEEWRGREEQTDDVGVVAVRV